MFILLFSDIRKRNDNMDEITIFSNLEKLRHELPEGVQLVAVSKFHPSEMVLWAYKAGQKVFAESRVQELLSKIPVLPQDISWHFIGHLQTNKVKQIIGKTALIESVDTERLLTLIDKESDRAGVVTRVLLQLHVAQEETKFGFSPEEMLEYFRNRKYMELKATHICGVMGMASNTDDEKRIRSDFDKIADIYRQIKTEVSPELTGFDKISMGMTGDWPIAIESGANIVRIGSGIFGPRQY